MVTEEEKFRADTFRILGIALITPLASILFDPYAYFTNHNLIYCLLFLPFAIIMAAIGMIHIEFARGILDLRGQRKWKSQV